MATVWQASVADLYRVEGKAGLVGGELRMMSPASGKHARAALAISASVRQVEKSLRGFAFCENVGYLADLPHRRSFSPDAAFYVGPPLTEGFLPGLPVFAVEFRSPEDYGPTAEQRLLEKQSDYFAAGTQGVWDVDLQGESTIPAYASDAPNAPRLYRRGEVANAEPAVPGWKFPVAELIV